MAAVGYRVVFGSIIAINAAYMYLIRNVSPALATSYLCESGCRRVTWHWPRR